jgi:hypothetical protein
MLCCEGTRRKALPARAMAWSTTNDDMGEVVHAKVWSNVGGRIGLEAPARDMVDYSRARCSTQGTSFSALLICNI